MTEYETVRKALVASLRAGDYCAACGNPLGEPHAHGCVCEGSLEALDAMDAEIRKLRGDLRRERDRKVERRRDEPRDYSYFGLGDGPT